jgi:predicted NUDIX family NTP pyrophosphohydrolase
MSHDEFTKLYLYMEKRFDKIEAELAKKATPSKSALIHWSPRWFSLTVSSTDTNVGTIKLQPSLTYSSATIRLAPQPQAWLHRRMKKRSAGILLYKYSDGQVYVMLVHPGGPFWSKKDLTAWSIPKGEILEDEDPLSAARREFQEELGASIPKGEPADLGSVKQSSKEVLAWALEGDLDTKHVKSNMFEMEWPPKSGTMQEFPEVDKVAWFDLATARTKIVKGQAELLERLADKLGVPIPEPIPQSSAAAAPPAAPDGPQISLF